MRNLLTRRQNTKKNRMNIIITRKMVTKTLKTETKV